MKKKSEKIGYKFTFHFIQVGRASILYHHVEKIHVLKLIYYMCMSHP